MRPDRSIYSLIAFLLAALIAVPANAAAIVGGTTKVTLTAAPTLTNAGISVAPTGTATVMVDSMGNPVVTFPITGGSVSDGGNALIEHNGSGLLFTSGSNSLALADFLINTASGTISGSATANGTLLGTVPLFSLGAGNTLALTQPASNAFNTVFGVNLPAGTVVGTASVNPVLGAVPEPAT
jgi:hypothetical protein